MVLHHPSVPQGPGGRRGMCNRDVHNLLESGFDYNVTIS